MAPGVCGESQEKVNSRTTASTVGSGELAVFSTPSLIARMELTALASVQPFLPEGYSTVGTHMDVKHLAATPVGMTVRCETILTEVDRRRLVFSCKAYDEAGLIGEGTQERFIVENARFMAKALHKLDT